MATLGFVPWLSSFTIFFTHRALDPVRMLVAQTHANVKIGAAYSGLLTGYTGKTHQDVEDLAIMRAMPGMTVLAPADEFECAAMIRWATDYVGPVYLRLTRDPGPAVFGPDYHFEPGSLHQLHEGSDLLMISTGTQSPRCVEAAQELKKEGIAAAVLHVPTIKPVRTEDLLSFCEKFDLVFTVEEHSRLGGLGGLVTEILSEHSPRRVVRLGLQDEWGESAPNDFLLDKYRLSGRRVAEQIVSKRKQAR
jgi:transketolase